MDRHPSSGKFPFRVAINREPPSDPTGRLVQLAASTEGLRRRLDTYQEYHQTRLEPAAKRIAVKAGKNG